MGHGPLDCRCTASNIMLLLQQCACNVMHGTGIRRSTPPSPRSGSAPMQCVAQALEALREEWQAVVIERLMHAKRALGMPLAKRQLSAAQLAELRQAGPALASQRIAAPRAAAEARVEAALSADAGVAVRSELPSGEGESAHARSVRDRPSVSVDPWLLAATRPRL